MRDLLMEFMKRFSNLSDNELENISRDICVNHFEKGEILLQQGDVPDTCYFVLKGCVRQFFVDEDGKEHTYHFFTEEQSVTIFNHHKTDKKSKYSLSCVEDCVLIVGDLEVEQDMYNTYPVLEGITRKMIEENMGELHDNFSLFMSSKPENRYRILLETRPTLITRVPQHQLASYLGITPESLSRIKKRLEN